MKWLLLSFLFLIVSCSQLSERTPAAKSEVKHVVFDIDWTIVGEVKKPNSTIIKNKRVINVEGTYYFVNEGVEDFIDEILSHKDMRVSFYSGGGYSRNHDLLSKIKLKNGKSLKDIAYKILSKEDLYVVDGVSETAKFGERFKKDLSKISKDLDQLIMLDDTPNFFLDAADKQERSFFFIGRAFEFFDKFEDARGQSGPYIPRTNNEWLLDKKKIFVLNGAFKEAYSESVTTGIPFSEAMKKQERLLNLESRSWNELSSKYYKAFSGREVLKALPASHSSSCVDLTKAILGF